jgi:hypothetical protein
MLDSLDLQLPLMAMQVGPSQSAKATLVVPPAERLYSRLCAGARDADGGVVIGRVRDVDDGTPVQGAVVATEWVEHSLVAGKASAEVMATAVRADSAGLFVLCNVPTQVPLLIRARVGTIMVGPARLSLDDRLLGRADLAVSRRDTAANYMVVSDTIVPGHDVAGSAVLRGRVVRHDGSPAPGVTIGVPGSGRRTISNSEGRFLLDGIAAGTRLIDVRTVSGGSLLQQTVDFATGATNDIALALSPPTQTLATVTTTERAFRRSGFEASGFLDRQRMGLGAFVTEAELRGYSATDLSDLLARMRGVSVERGRSGDQPSSMPMMRGMIQPRCIPAFFVDGVRFMVDGATRTSYPYTDLLTAVRPDFVKAVEVYASPGGIPVQFDVTALEGCGSIVIWTR